MGGRGEREDGGRKGGDKGRECREGGWRERGGGKTEGGRKGDPLTVTQLLRGNLTAISSHKRKPRVAGRGQPEGDTHTDEKKGGE